MAMYNCSECSELTDDDHNPGTEHPYKECELVCEDCMLEVEERIAAVDDTLNAWFGDSKEQLKNLTIRK